MKKSIVALAVSSAALASISAYAAEETSVDFYGNIQYAYTHSDQGSQFADNGSTLGVKGESKVTDNTTAFFKYELEFDADEKGTTDSNIDQAFVGLKGDFGKFQVGTFDTVYNNAIQDGIDQMENIAFTNGAKTSEGDTLAYYSPEVGGFEIQVAAQTKGGGDTIDVADDGTSTMAVIKYSMDMVAIALAYDSRHNQNINNNDTIGLAVTVTPSDVVSITAKYETAEGDADYLGVAARYSYGPGDIYGSIQNVDPDSTASDYSEYAAGITYSINSSMYIYGELGRVGSTKDDVTAVGVTYVF
ncbi:MAG: porin [Marinomonas sp.]